MNKIEVSSIKRVLDETKATLESSQRSIKGSVGWHQHLGSRKIGVEATSMALVYFKNVINEKCPNEVDVLKFISNSQNEDGGWAHLSNTRGVSNTIATCWAVNALSLYEDTYSCQISKAISWLEQQHCFSIEDIGWGFINSRSPRVYNTCLVLHIYRNLYRDAAIKSNTHIDSSFKWLCNLQNQDGGWGEVKGAYSSLFFTSYVVNTLSLFNDNNISPNIERAMNWIDSYLSKTNLADSSLECYLEFIEENINEELTRTPFFHYVLPQVIIALINNGRKDESMLFECVGLLIKRFQNGYYKHPFVEDPRIKPMWALFDSSEALRMFSIKFIFRKRSNCTLLRKNSILFLVSIHKKIYAIKRFDIRRLLIFSNYTFLKIIAFALLFGLVFYLLRIAFINNSKYFDLNKEFVQSIIASIVASIICIVFSRVWDKLKIILHC